MRKLASLVLAVILSLAAVGALAAASAGFPCDFIHVSRPKLPACSPPAAPLDGGAPLVS